MKYYIFITEDIHPIGGMQEYVACKSKYLAGRNWNVCIIHNGQNVGVSSIPSLTQYIYGGFEEISIIPFYWPYEITKDILSRIISKIRIVTPCESVIIESHNDRCALWGELLAPRIGAKHVCFLCNELFDGPGKHYKDYIDYFDYKHNRGELTAISEKSIPSLFSEYKTIETKDIYVFKAATSGIAEYSPNFDAESIERSEWNICYIGRAKKGYVPKIFNDIGVFAKDNPDHSISFIIIGDMSIHRDLIDSTLMGIRNLRTIQLGDMVPIPQQIFSLIDVAIAGAGCAICSIQNGVPTIIPDASNYKANGFWGYHTNSIFYAESDSIQGNYNEYLHNYFIDRVLDNVTLPLFDLINPDEEFEKQLNFIKSSGKENAYYSFSKEYFKKQINRDTIKYIIKNKFKIIYKIYKKIHV